MASRKSDHTSECDDCGNPWCPQCGVIHHDTDCPQYNPMNAEFDADEMGEDTEWEDEDG